jgi:NAD(P)-dependent dehydrogenase (short-subunit alcohol dehydrogenase family)
MGSALEQPLSGRLVLVTGAARRIGRALALACAEAGADVIVHYDKSAAEASQTRDAIDGLGRAAWTVQADLARPETAEQLIGQALEHGNLYGLVNNAAVFEERGLQSTSNADWDRSLSVNLTAPFLLCRAFASALPQGAAGRIVNILDWRSLRPDADHFAYSVSKAALAALTRSVALALAPAISVNGLALGAIMPPERLSAPPDLLGRVPAGRWGTLREVQDALLFLLTGPAYITGEVLHVDGGRHVV